MARATTMSAFSKAASATCVAAAVAFTVLAGSMSASAAPVDCATLGATTITPGVCQIVVTTSGTFTAPAGVTHLEALLVAGGTGGGDDFEDDGYAAGLGGEVVYVNNVSLTALTVTIGAGGAVGGAAATTTAIADGNSAATAGPAVTSLNSVTGVVPSTFVATENPASTLFPAYTGEQPLAGDGAAGTFRDPATPGTAYTAAGGGTVGTFANALANTGSGGGGASLSSVDLSGIPGGNGANGVVLFRFAAPDDGVVAAALPVTGSDASTATAAAGVLLLGGTAALLAGRRRRARA